MVASCCLFSQLYHNTRIHERQVYTTYDKKENETILLEELAVLTQNL
jgi:hypothetical protein